MNIKITDLFEHYTGEAADLRETARVSPERIRQLTMEKLHLEERSSKRPTGRALKVTLIAAALAVLLMAGALAVGSFITSEGQALAVARRELQVWKDMGILTADVKLDGENLMIWKDEEGSFQTDDWPHRILNPIYYIRNYGGKYSTNVCVDTITGKIIDLTIQAWADEDAEPVPGKQLVVQPDDQVFYYYENFGDIFDPAMTVGEFCAKLADYWGYDGFTIRRKGEDFRGDDLEGPAGELLADCYSPYIPVYFHGDQEGAPQYIQVMDLPSGAVLMVGVWGHSLG